MSQSRVTDFYAQRRSSRRIGAQVQKRRKLSSSSDLLTNELVPCKKQKSELQVQEFFKNIELNCETKSIKFGPNVTFQEFTKALNSTSSPDQGTKVKAPEVKPAVKSVATAKQRQKRGRKQKKEPVKNEKAELKPSSTLDQYLDRKMSKVPDTAATLSDSTVDSKEAILKPQKEKTPTKRGHDEAKAPIRRKKAKDASEVLEESGYSSQSSLSDNQLPVKRTAAAKRCLGDQFQGTPGTNDNIPLSPSPSGITKSVTGGRQHVSRKEGQTRENATEQISNPIANKSPLKDRIKMAMAEHNRSKEGARTNLEKGKEIKKKMSPEEVRAKLAKCGKLKELQAVLGKVKKSAQVRKEVPKPTEEKQPETIPAYKKYRHLAVAAPPSLLLPGKYKTLAEMFQSMDTVVSMLHNRMEQCSFSKLKAGVQEICRKTFQPKNLGQIKTVYPSSFHLYQQKCSRSISQRGTVKNSNGGYELMVGATLDDAVNDSANPSTVASGSSGTSTMKDIHSRESFLQKFTPSVLIARRTVFHSNLIDIVKQQHRAFLQEQSPPLAVPDEKITRWHPKFPLEQVHDIEPAALPQPPNVQTYSTAKDVLDKARDLMNPKVVKALELIAQRNEEKSPEPTEKFNTTIEPAIAAKPSSGVSSDLLGRIRAKEARQTQAAMMRSQIDEDKIGRLERLPEVCLIVRGLFLAEKKAALTVDVVIKKVGDSCKASLSQAQLEKHIDLMLEILPEWIKSLKIRKETYLKIDKKKELKDLTNQIAQVLKKEKRK